MPMRSSDADWAALIGRIANGEQDALAKLYDQSSRLVYSIALRVLSDTADAEEVTLDVYSQVWRMARDYSGERGTPSTWLVMLARSRALDRLRSRESRRQRESALDEVFEAPSKEAAPEEVALASAERTRVRRAMAQLAPEQREAIELAFFTGLSHSELASRLRQPLGTVKTRIRLGMIRLRQALGVPEEVL